MTGPVLSRLYSRRVIRPGGAAPGCVHMAAGRITAVTAERPAGAAVVDLGDAWVGPGWIDLHTHGRDGVGGDNLSPERADHLARSFARCGVTAFLLSTVTAPERDLVRALTTAAAAAPTGGAAFLGIHLEGPFLNPACAGAQVGAHCRPADPAEAERLLAAGRGVVRMVTLAPECDPDLAVTRLFVAAGVVVALGHSAADADTVARAVEAGAGVVTHLFNGMPAFHHRRPGLVGAALSHRHLACELIVDGVHLSAEAVRLAVAAKGWERCLLVSDSIPAAGLADGEYLLGERPIRLEGGVARTREGNLAGSTLGLDAAVPNAARAAGVPLDVAARMASTVPARVIGDDSRGVIVPGRRADFTVFDDHGVRMTVVAAEVVHERP